MFRLVCAIWCGSSRPVLQLSACAAQISRVVNSSPHPGPHPSPKRASSSPEPHALIEERLALLEAEGLEATAWDTLYAGCVYSRKLGDKKGASAWASRAANLARLALGRDSLEFQKYAEHVSSRHVGKKK
mmetsp:Transcript_11166/g.22548  ORF Transcript_11166/g.22548 Transcript_11166/m.22548 type:complete len:130 (+) Transcript_11166:1105-1494(+)